MKTDQLAPEALESLRRISTCVAASSIERFGVRLPNTGFANSTIRSIFEDRPPVVGYAATARMRSSQPPMAGKKYYYHTEWWKHILSIPEPRFIVLEDLDKPAGLGGFVGEVQTYILMALGCVGLATNGTIRDVSLIKPTGFQVFATGVAISHAYAHIVDFGGKVSVGGLEVQPGDLIQGDRHGVQTIPLEIADKVPAVAQHIMDLRRQLVALCRSSDFSVEKLRSAIHEAEDSLK